MFKSCSHLCFLQSPGELHVELVIELCPVLGSKITVSLLAKVALQTHFPALIANQMVLLGEGCEDRLSQNAS